MFNLILTHQDDTLLFDYRHAWVASAHETLAEAITEAGRQLKEGIPQYEIWSSDEHGFVEMIESGTN
jgi:hypothetical protein